MPDCKSFGTYLKHQRELRGMSLEHVAGVTKISRSLLGALEEDDVSKWPAGIFRRAFFRAYASTIGLDPTSLMDDFSRLFARPGDKVRARVAAGEFHRPYSTTLRLTLAADESRAQFMKEAVAPALVDALLVVALALVAAGVGRGHIAVGIAVAVLYHAVPKALGWQTLGAVVLGRVTARRSPARRASPKEGVDIRWKQTPPGTVEPRLVIRSIDESAQSRRAG